MPQITLELLRKRVEHNEGEIQTVEELALHQEKIEKLENLDKWCRKLKILLLQNNLIAKIENIGRLKELQYLNLALNNVEIIENLEGCESLTKLDLTLNFVGEISTVKNLRHNLFLESLYLTGNPCVDFPGYRQYVLNALPQLTSLDGIDITPTERLKARQDAKDIEEEILDWENEYKERRLREKSSYNASLPKERIKTKKSNTDNSSGDTDDGDGDESVDEVIDTDDYWNKVTPNTPEIRTELSMHSLKLEEKSRNAKSSLKPKEQQKKQVSLFFPDGRPRNINEGKISFSLHDEQTRNVIVLDLAVPKFLDSSLIQADVQPTYATCLVKGKIFQIVLPEEVKPDSSVAQRSKTTGHLVITMPKLNQTKNDVMWKGSACSVNDADGNNSLIENAVSAGNQSRNNSSRSSKSTSANNGSSRCPSEKATIDTDWRNIVPPEKQVGGDDGIEAKGHGQNTIKDHKPKKPDESGENEMDPKSNFVDNPDVPPLL